MTWLEEEGGGGKESRTQTLVPTAAGGLHHRYVNEECSHPVVPRAPDFWRTIRMQSTRDVTHGVLFNTNLETHLVVSHH